MNRVLMFFRVLKYFLSVDSCVSRKNINLLVGLLLELDCVLRILEKERNHIILLMVIYSSM